LTKWGETIGYLVDRYVNGRQAVEDRHHNLVGYIADDGTWDASWHRVADYGDPGLLLG
jgi:hypothetical protein